MSLAPPVGVPEGQPWLPAGVRFPDGKNNQGDTYLTALGAGKATLKATRRLVVMPFLSCGSCERWQTEAMAHALRDPATVVVVQARRPVWEALQAAVPPGKEGQSRLLFDPSMVSALLPESWSNPVVMTRQSHDRWHVQGKKMGTPDGFLEALGLRLTADEQMVPF